MDQSILVKAGHLIVNELDTSGLPPRAAVWIHATDTDTWKLWIVPHHSAKDIREFYRLLSAIVTNYRTELGGVDAADAELISESHPVIQGMKGIFKTTGLGSVMINDCLFNGVFVQEAIILRMNL
jgi:hypothetical protein